jgi:hypothetical protein
LTNKATGKRYAVDESGELVDEAEHALDDGHKYMHGCEHAQRADADVSGSFSGELIEHCMAANIDNTDL